MKCLLSTRHPHSAVTIFSLLNITFLIFALFSPAFCQGDEPDKAPDKLVVGHFSQGVLDNWEKKEFNGDSQYQLIQVDDQMILKGTAKSSASGLFKKIRVDLSKTPFLNWSWRVEKPHPPLDETTKQGDDYAARVYIVVDGGLFFWKTIALNYVWSSQQLPGSTWPNAYAGKNVMLMSLKSSSDSPQTWYTEKRNVLDDFKKLFDKDITHIDAVAVMTDSDDSGGDVTAYYGDIFFTSK